MHDLVVHAILHPQQRHHLGFVLYDTLHERLVQSGTLGSHALHRGRQLTIIASQDDARHLADGYPAGGLKGLGCLVDEECPELHPLQQTVGTAHQRTGHDTCLAKQLGVDAYLYLGSTALQTVHLLMEAAVATMAFLPHLANGLSDGPQLRIVGMRLEAPLVGERQHLVVDACGIADAQDVHPTVHQLFRYPVYRHVTLRTNQHLWLAP